MSFQCQQFYLKDDRCAMKVSTDSLLLGSWATVKPSDRTILDVGTGCGILALMAAQRTAASTSIAAIDLDHDAVQQAQDNVAASPWPTKIYCAQADFMSWQPTERYDLILSNPPYFPQQLQSPEAQRRLARQGNFPLTVWLEKMVSWLNPNGRIAWILPLAVAAQLKVPATLALLRHCEVATVVGKLPKLVLLEWTTGAASSATESLAIRTTKGVYTAEFRQLTSAFYLAGEHQNH